MIEENKTPKDITAWPIETHTTTPDGVTFTNDTDFGELGDVPLTAGIGGPVIGTAKLSGCDSGIFVSCTVSPGAKEIAESMNAITKAWRDSGVSKDD